MYLEASILDVSTSGGPVNKVTFNYFVSLLMKVRSALLGVVVVSQRLFPHYPSCLLLWHEGVSPGTTDLHLLKTFPCDLSTWECVGTKGTCLRAGRDGVGSWSISDEHFMFRSHLDVTPVCVDKD